MPFFDIGFCWLIILLSTVGIPVLLYLLVKDPIENAIALVFIFAIVAMLVGNWSRIIFYMYQFHQ